MDQHDQHIDQQQDDQHDPLESAIAIVGMACHLPGALNIDEYWQNLRSGTESIKFYAKDELAEKGESASNLNDPNYVAAQPHLENYDRFDAGFWGFNPQDAAVTDPAHRLFLEVAYESLEHSGHTGGEEDGAVGVFASSGASLYWMENLRSNPQLIEQMGEFLVRHTGNDMNFLATRLSYELDLRGPSINVQTACSSTHVCVHMAAQSLLNGECDMAIAGASTVLLPQERGYVYRDGEIMSPDGHCRPFDAKSAGTVFGSGAGALVLRRLEDAIADGDTIYGLVRGSAINNDGSQKIGYLAPSVDGQVGAIAEALEIAEVDAADISFVEAHGTGTQVGDPIEFEALQQVYGEATEQKQYCDLGSVKSNIGHLGEAAGAAALIKVCLSMVNKELPGTVNYQSPNAQLDLANSPFKISAQLKPWQSDKPLMAAVTGLGAGGTNAHIVMQEAPAPEATDESAHSQQLLNLSAKTDTALKSAQRRLLAALRQGDKDLADVAYTLQLGRRAYQHRSSLVAASVDEAIAKLDAADAGGNLVQASAPEGPRKLVFMLPGGGAQYSGMGASLYQKQSVYREAFDACMDCLEPNFAAQVMDLVFAPAEQQAEATRSLQRPTLTLTSLFATEYAQAKLLMSWGLVPDALIGHSMGENTAACLAGVMRLQDAMQLVYLRGQLFERAPEGGMLGISLPSEQAQRYFSENLEFAAINSPDLCVATGPKDALQALQTKLEADDINCSIVRINVAAHSAMLDSVLDDFGAYLRSIELRAPEIRFTSNLTGTWISDAQAMSPDYWVQHLRSTVRFADNIATVQSLGSALLLEVGPGHTLSNLAKANVDASSAVLASMRHPSESGCDLNYAQQALGAAWCHGANVDWQAYWGDEYRHRIALPSYPFERKAYWVDLAQHQDNKAPATSDQLVKRADIDQWFGQLRWQQGSLANQALKPSAYLVFAGRDAFSQALLAQLNQQKMPLKVVYVGEQFAQEGDHYQLDPSALAQFQQLADSVFSDTKFSDTQVESEPARVQVVYLWSMLADVPAAGLLEQVNGVAEHYQQAQKLTFEAQFNLAKVLAEQDLQLSVMTVTDRAYSLAGEQARPMASLASGPALVMPRELPHVRSKLVDLALLESAQPAAALQQLAASLVQEMASDDDCLQVAYRGRMRWCRAIEPAPVAELPRKEQWAEGLDTVLISGGMGGIGLAVAKRLAERGCKRLVLLGRTALPAAGQWPSLLAAADTPLATKVKLQALLALREQGVEVLPIAADVCDGLSLQTALVQAGVELAAVDAVIHAAGSMDDELLHEKTQERAQQVLQSKVMGALTLDALFAEQDLTLFMAFSSVASYLGLPGQIDYTSANAFLDAFIAARAAQRSGRSLVVNWSAWKDVGMAAHLEQTPATTVTLDEAEGSAIASNVWQQRVQVDDAVVFSKDFSVAQDWLLAEHKTQDGVYLLPGTAYIELAREALAHYLPEQSLSLAPFSLRDLAFLSAFDVGESGSRRLHLKIEPEIHGQQDRLQLSFYAEDEDLPLATLAGYAGSQAQPEAGVAEGAEALAELAARCQLSKASRDAYLDQDFMAFGPRWGCIESIHYQAQEALVALVLPESFEAELQASGAKADRKQGFALHPALLDMAIGSAQFLKPGVDLGTEFYVPVSYQHIAIYAPMPARVFSHIVCQADSPDGELHFDIRLLTPAGELVASLDGFKMQRLRQGFASSATSASALASDMAEHNLTPEQARLAEILAQGIEPDEGVEALERLLAAQTQDEQFIIASIDTQVWRRQLSAQQVDSEGDAPGLVFVHEQRHDPDVDPEIPEIEAQIAAHSAVEQVVVRSFLDDDGRRRLIAYYIADDWASVTVTELRKDLQAQLTREHMPQQLLQVDGFEHDEQGEIVRHDLLDPFAPVDHYIAPETPTQKRLAAIWQAVVGVPRVGLNENFFDIGGHSLLSIRVIVKVKKEFGVRLDQAKMVLLTLEQMAQEIDQQAAETSADSQSAGSVASDSPRASSNDRAAAEEATPSVSVLDSSLDSGQAQSEPLARAAQAKSKKGLFSSLFKKS